MYSTPQRAGNVELVIFELFYTFRKSFEICDRVSMETSVSGLFFSVFENQPILSEVSDSSGTQSEVSESSGTQSEFRTALRNFSSFCLQFLTFPKILRNFSETFREFSETFRNFPKLSETFRNFGSEKLDFNSKSRNQLESIHLVSFLSVSTGIALTTVVWSILVQMASLHSFCVWLLSKYDNWPQTNICVVGGSKDYAIALHLKVLVFQGSRQCETSLHLRCLQANPKFCQDWGGNTI